jgi:hypothetical protein
MKDGAVSIGRWHYSVPPDAAGVRENSVVISMHSVAPAEIFEWGINTERQPYEQYKWCEDGFFEDGSYCKVISKTELLNKLENMITLFKANGHGDLAANLETVKTRITDEL